MSSLPCGHLCVYTAWNGLGGKLDLDTCLRIKRKALAMQLLSREHCTPRFLVKPLLSFQTLKRGKPASAHSVLWTGKAFKGLFPKHRSMLQEELKFTVGWDIFLFSGDSEFESGLLFQNMCNRYYSSL